MFHPTFRRAAAGRRRPLGHRAGALVPALCGMLLAAGASAARTTPPAPALEDPYTPRFYLEAISVEGLERASAAVIVAESRLETGRAYTEQALRAAGFRVERLPFVLESALALRPGSERGRYRLVITVWETHRFFFGWEQTVSRFEPGLDLGRDSGVEQRSEGAPVLGLRVHAGRYDVLYAALEDGGATLGYERYNVFRPGGLLRLAWEIDRGEEVTVLPLHLEPAFANWRHTGSRQQITLALVLPVAADQALRFTARHQRSDAGTRRDTLASLDRVEDFAGWRRDQLDAFWHLDTTDDPLFPTLGTSARAGLRFGRLRAELGAAAAPLDRRALRASVSAAHHWPLGDRHTAGLEVHLAIGRARLEDAAGDQDVEVWGVGLGARHAMRLWRLDVPGRRADLWWENGVALSVEAVSPQIASAPDPLRTLRVETALAYRTSWGVLRLAFSLIELDGDG